jgi:serine/threonine protein kinase
LTTSDPWSRALGIFQEIADLAPAERSGRVAEACAEDPALRRLVEALISADAEEDARLDGGVARLFPRLVPNADSSLERWIGRRLGPYRIVRELGRGGMGAVFLGERCDGQFEQRVALKVARLGLSGDEAVRRFLAERRILAGLEHPRIARLLDGGVSAEGLPFFAMEYVAGLPITEYCRNAQLDVGQRIRLFLGVCDAVGHAHRRLVVHRDLKPSNIFVSVTGEVKLLDFGIAKLLDAGDERTRTRTLHQMLTPAYAAPEQVRGDAVTTATDVYALGVVLYELLVGRRPFGAPAEAAVAALGDEPMRASAAVLARDSSPAPVRRRLRRTLRGDLDTILLTALRKEPDRRYLSAEALAEDLRRHLDRRPIRARRDSMRYRAEKFVARHRWTLAIATTLLVALVGALAAVAFQARAREREALASQEVTSFLVRLFEGSDPTLARGASLTAQELLDEGVGRLRSTLTREPVVRSRLLRTMAASYVALGLYDRARPLAEEALRLRQETFPARSVEVADSMDQLGEILRLEADYAHAEPLLRAALAARRAALAPDDPAVIDSLGHLGRLLEDRGEFAAAESLLRDALAATERRFGLDSTQSARRLDDFASNQSDLGREKTALELLRRALGIRETKLGRGAPEVAASLETLGARLDAAGDYGEAVADLERALAIRRRIYGAAHPLVATTELALASVYEDQERLDDAERAAQGALDALRRSLGADHPKVGEALNLLAVVRTARRDFGGAVPLFRELLARYERLAGRNHPDTLAIKSNLAITLLHAGSAHEAEALQREILAQLPADDGQDTGALARENLATSLEIEGRARAAVPFAREALELQRRREGETSGNVAIALRSLALAEEQSGDARKAEKDFRSGLRMGEQLALTHGNATYEWKVPLADFLVGANRCPEALALLASATAELQKVRTTADPIWRLEEQVLTGECTPQSPKSARALRAARETLRAMPGADVDVLPTVRALLAPAPQGPIPPRRRAPQTSSLRRGAS